MHVEEDDVGPLRRHGCACLLERPGLTDLELLELEVDAREETQARVVFDHQH